MNEIRVAVPFECYIYVLLLETYYRFISLALILNISSYSCKDDYYDFVHTLCS